MRVPGQFPIAVSLLASGVGLGAQVPPRRHQQSPVASMGQAPAHAQAPQSGDGRKILPTREGVARCKTVGRQDIVATGTRARAVTISFPSNSRSTSSFGQIRKDEIPAQETALSSMGSMAMG
jgi:hypothetical protein